MSKHSATLQQRILSAMQGTERALLPFETIAELAPNGTDRLDVANVLELMQNAGLVQKAYIRERHGDGDLKEIGWMLTLRGNTEGAPTARAVFLRVVAVCPKCGNESPAPGDRPVVPGVEMCWNCNATFLVTRDAVVKAEVR